MQKFTEIRLTLVAYIHAMEMDLRAIIETFIIPSFQDMSFIKNPALIDRIKKRFQADNRGLIAENNLSETINFIDFQDSYTIILTNESFVPEEMFSELKKLIIKLDEIAPIRNRVMHSRPLLAGDFSTVFEFVMDLNTLSKIPWTQTLIVKQKIEQNPYFVLSLNIPSYAFNDTSITNNLPIPDFDETGFIGRKKDVEDVKKLLLSNNRVVSIIGDGGVGKTSLMLKVAYDLLDMKENCPFDLIIWTTAKTTMLTATGIQEIADALRNSDEVLGNISDIVKSDKETVNDRIQEILEYFEVFNVLLIIDNLETILDGTIKDFIRESSMKCKIAITSRIGLGELEYRRLLTGLTDVESVQLIKQIASVRNTKVLLKLTHANLVDIAKKLYHSPLALKWFVNSVDTGLSPSEILNKKADLLNFCLTNVYSKLSQDAKKVINTILASRRALNDAELSYLTNLKHLDLRRAVNELSTTTLLSKEIKTKNQTQEVSFTISSFAKDYLIKEHPINSEFIKSITGKIRTLNESVSSIKRADESNEFGLNALVIRNSNEKVVARLVREALTLSKREHYKEAFQKLEEAKDIAPNYFEIYRVSGFLKAQSDDLIGAEEDYKLGLEIEPDHPRLLFYYAQFLLFQLDDIETALFLSNKLNNLRPNSPYPTFLHARCTGRNNKYEEAIGILNGLLENNFSMTSRDRIIAQTDIIGFYNSWATEKIKLERDYQTAITLFLKGINLFESCVPEREYDLKMVKHLCDIFLSYITLVPKMYTEDYIQVLQSFFVTHINLFSLHHSMNIIVSRFKEKYGIELASDSIIENFSAEQKYKGTLNQVYESRPYAFINAEDSNRYFVHRDSFMNISSWAEVKENQIVRFNLGTNSSGVCAVNVIICDSDN